MGKDGRMVIEVPPSLAQTLGIERTQALEDLDQATASAILANQTAFEEMDVRDIAMEQFTETQKIGLNVSQIAAMMQVEFAKTYRGMGAEVDKYVKMGNDMLEKYVTGKEASGELKSVLDEQRAALQKAVSEDQKQKGASGTPQQPLNVNNNQNTTQTQQNNVPLNTNTDSTPSEQFLMRLMNELNRTRGNIVIQNNVDPTNERSYTKAR